MRFGGIELGGTKTVCGVGRADQLEAEARFPTTDPHTTLAHAIGFFRQHLPLGGVGIAAFGPLTAIGSGRGVRIGNTPKPGWSNFPLAEIASEGLGIPVAVDTDTNGAALAEWQLGAGRGADPVVYVTVGTGIGGGAMIGGRIHHGHRHLELGHIGVPRYPGDTYPGNCPFHRDCLEGLASGPALAARWGTAPEVLAFPHPAWEMEAEYLAAGMAAIVYLLSPQRIVLGGGVMGREGLLEMVSSRLRVRMAGYLPSPELRAPELSDRAGVLGALLIAQALADEANAPSGE